MARLDIIDPQLAGIAPQEDQGDLYLRLGLMYATGRTVTLDRVAAHKWLNIAAARGNSEAAQHRQELAGEMSPPELTEALRQAREWLRLN